MMAQGRWQDAIEWFETISAVLKNDPDLFKAGFAGDVDWAIALLATGKIAEEISGLCRAFFYAAAQALLITNWRVETNSAKALTTDLFRR